MDAAVKPKARYTTEDRIGVLEELLNERYSVRAFLPRELLDLRTTRGERGRRHKGHVETGRAELGEESRQERGPALPGHHQHLAAALAPGRCGQKEEQETREDGQRGAQGSILPPNVAKATDGRAQGWRGSPGVESLSRTGIPGAARRRGKSF